ncbi:hypothetical protein [Streptomyces echinatus]|uniref:Uncharacterized protein n=1 Tax=Streptomyces echinatus TaxID=67293 RepID=A0A7W9PUL1_9ACTN|nr:hypothetical protein [Streptomyces echinatus]MBB5927718.1 hypothetical protein [Streptomyces echinatus]
MSSQEATFVDRVMSGQALLMDIDDYVDEWHDSSDDLGPLHQFLGLTDVEYSLWVERPESIRFIIAARRTGVTPQRAQDLSSVALAARAKDDSEAAGVLDWLIKTGRVEN